MRVELRCAVCDSFDDFQQSVIVLNHVSCRPAGLSHVPLVRRAGFFGQVLPNDFVKPFSFSHTSLKMEICGVVFLLQCRSPSVFPDYMSLLEDMQVLCIAHCRAGMTGCN